MNEKFEKIWAEVCKEIGCPTDIADRIIEARKKEEEKYAAEASGN